MKKHNSKTQQELLENTINYFTSENRSIDNNSEDCTYITEDGKRCAIGIELTKPLAKKLSINNDGIENDDFDYLPKRLKSMTKSFLINIQELHDGHDYWDKKGLTIQGKRAVKRIVNKYNLILPENIK